MNIKLKQQLIDWADIYETPDFIKTDPIQFPHRFTRKQDIEISAFVTAYLAFGQRAQIIKRVNDLHQIMGNSPYDYVMKGDFTGFPISNRKFYRFISYTDINQLLTALRSCYLHNDDLETAIIKDGCKHPVEGLQKLFGHIHYMPSPESNSACKRISMFLRWLCRPESKVDMGIWRSVDPTLLLIPVDTHVHKMSLKLGITKRKSADMVTALEIHRYFKKVFPKDPARGDFSLFGYAVSNPGYGELVGKVVK